MATCDKKQAAESGDDEELEFDVSPRRDLSEVAAALRSAGMAIDRESRTLRRIAGKGGPRVVAAARELEGVHHIEAPRRYQLPPLSEDIPQ